MKILRSQRPDRIAYMKEFRKRNPRYQRDRYRANKEKARQAHRDWVAANPKRARIHDIWHRVKNRKKLDALKAAGKCAHCSVTDSRVLQWAHKKDKRKTSALNAGFGWSRLEKELKKCILLCANCHILYDWNTRKNQDKRKRSKEFGKLCEAGKKVKGASYEHNSVAH